MRDLDAGHVAAVLAWHFEPGPTEQAARGRSRGKTLAATPDHECGGSNGAAGAMRGEYMVMLWYLLLVVAAIDRRTVKRGRIGMVADRAIVLTPVELRTLGLRRGPSHRHGGYAGRDYYELST